MTGKAVRIPMKPTAKDSQQFSRRIQKFSRRILKLVPSLNIRAIS